MALNLIQNIDVTNKRVLLRTDFNVPLNEHYIVNDYRLVMELPTIRYLLDHQCTIVIATHLGQPQPQDQASLSTHPLSTTILRSWFAQHKLAVHYEPCLDAAQALSQARTHQIILLENLRFFPGEKTPSLKFAKTLARMGDIYINDAFGLLHRQDTSVTLVPKLFDKKSKAIGLLVEQEMTQLSKLQNHPTQPFVLVLGGCKIGKKIPMISHFLSLTTHRPETIILGGLLALVFLHVQDAIPAKPAVEPAVFAWAKAILKKAAHLNVELVMPIDLVWHAPQSTDLQTTSPACITDPESIVVDIGPATINLFVEKINTAETLFANGTMGMYEQPASYHGTKAILTAISTAQIFSVIGGGDTVAAAHLFNVAHAMSFCSTGGGATLAFLTADDPHQELPGLMHL